MTMQLKSLKIEREMWNHRPNFGQCTGLIVFDGELGEVQLKLTPDLCHKLFLLAADAIVGVAKEAATSLVLEAQATIAQDVTPAKVGP